jgi:RimJ/RimL family protein N-acetyltransferase
MGLVGIVGLSVPTVRHGLLPPVTVGWLLSPDVWGRGYATEAASALLDQAFTTMGLGRVECVMNAENRRSAAVATRLGMSVIGEIAVPHPDDGGIVTALMLEISRAAWRARQNEA